MAMKGGYGGKSTKKKMTTGGGKSRTSGTAKRMAGTKSTGTKKVGARDYTVKGPKY